jgi:hypothetical protein
MYLHLQSDGPAYCAIYYTHGAIVISYTSQQPTTNYIIETIATSRVNIDIEYCLYVYVYVYGNYYILYKQAAELAIYNIAM